MTFKSLRVSPTMRPPSRDTQLGGALQSALLPMMVAVGICLLAGAYVISQQPTKIDRYIITTLIGLVGALAMIANPPFLIDLFLVVIVTNRLIRRLLDWGEGRFDPVSAISTLPLILAGLMFLALLARWPRLSRPVQYGLICVGIALAYGFLIGLGNGAAALFSAGEYALPFVVAAYASLCRPTVATLMRWIVLFLGLGALVSIYGIIQWCLVPPWDARWLDWSGMSSSMGQPIPFKMSIASTLESRGPAAIYFATVCLVALGMPDIRKHGGIIVAMLAGFALILTRARAGLVLMVLALVVVSVFQGAKGGWRLIGTLCVSATLIAVALTSFEAAAPLVDRVTTLGAIPNDGSFLGRVQIATEGMGLLIHNPFGFGLGAQGNAVMAIGTKNVRAVGDNGYLEILTTLGIPGTLFYALGLASFVKAAWKDCSDLHPFQQSATLLGRAMIIAMFPGLVIGNCVIGMHATYVGILLSPMLAVRNYIPIRSKDRHRNR